MEIVLCHHYSLSFGVGGEKFLFSAAKELVKRGHEVEVRALPIMKKRNRFSQLVKYLSELGVEYQESWLHRVKGADVVYGPYVRLGPGNYSALFWIKVRKSISNEPSIVLDVVGDRATTTIAQLEVSKRDVPLGRWSCYKIDFNL